MIPLYDTSTLICCTTTIPTTCDTYLSTPTGNPTNGHPDYTSAKQKPTRGQQGPITCHHPLRHSPWCLGVWRGMVDCSTSVPPHPCKSPASAFLGAAGLAGPFGETRRCHSLLAPRLPRAHRLRGQERTTWKWSLSSGRTARRGIGSLPCCAVYSRRETRHEIIPLPPRALSETARLEPRSTRLFHPTGLFIQVQLQLLSPSVRPRALLQPQSHFPAYLSQLPPSVNTLA
jgi:hypothetical protein